jgi:hypothetical protein
VSAREQREGIDALLWLAHKIEPSKRATMLSLVQERTTATVNELADAYCSTTEQPEAHKREAFLLLLLLIETGAIGSHYCHTVDREFKESPVWALDAQSDPTAVRAMLYAIRLQHEHQRELLDAIDREAFRNAVGRRLLAYLIRSHGQKCIPISTLIERYCSTLVLTSNTYTEAQLRREASVLIVALHFDGAICTDLQWQSFDMLKGKFVWWKESETKC